MKGLERIGRYTITGTLGAGGMGRVYLAEDTALGRRVAIKLLRDDVEPGGAINQRFAREAHLTARLNHPSIVTIYDIGEVEGCPYIVMEYVRGKTLADIIGRKAPVSRGTKLRWLEELCLGLSAAHEHGLVHRDIKPSNLIVDGSGRLKILDFGIARRTGQDETGALVGTVGYMAPEQLHGEPVDQRSDIFSAGLVAYELLSYTRAFPQNTIADAMSRVVYEMPPALSTVVPDIDPAIEKTIARALAKRPADRFQSAQALAQSFATIRRPLDEATSDDLLDALGFEAVQDQSSIGTLHSAADKTPSPTLIAGARTRDVTMARRAPMSRTALPQGRPIGYGVAMAAGFAAVMTIGAVLWSLFGTPTLSTPERPPARPGSEVIASWLVEHGMAIGALLALVAAGGWCLAVWPSPIAAARRILAVGVRPRPLSSSRSARRPSVDRKQPPTVGAASRESNPDSDPVSSDLDKTVFSRARPPATLAASAGPDNSIILPRPIGPSPGNASAPAPHAAQLVVIHCGDARLIGRSFPIDAMPFEIGRDEGANLPLRLSDCSRRQAVIEQNQNGFSIHDLGSANGTFVNGRRIRGAEPLFLNAQIGIGQTVLCFTQSADTALPDLTGAVLEERYDLTSLLRTTAKGAVYSARDRKAPRRVAIKLLSPHLAKDFPGYFEQFLREASTAAELSHPHICPLIDYGEGDIRKGGQSLVRTHFLCLTMMDGGSLADRLQAEEVVPFDVLSRWLGQLSAALDFAHRRGVVHGALKPSAIVFDQMDNAYVTDFSSAHRESAAPGRTWLGTPPFMAPEQWEGGDWTAATDQFAFAVIAYYWLTGVVPFEGQDHPEIRRRNFARGPVPAHEETSARTARPRLHRQTSGVLQQALSVDPQRRFASVDQFVRALVASLDARNSRTYDYDVFISYVRKRDSGWASLFARELKEKHGMSVFLDVEFRDGAGRFPDKLSKAIEGSKVFICFLHSTTLSSKWVTQEIQMAHQFQVPMIPVFQESFQTPESIESLDPSIDTLLQSDGVHLMDERNVHIDHSVKDVAELVKRTIGRF